MTRRLRPVGLDFLGAAPLRLVFHAEVAAAPDAVFHQLRTTADWPRWFAAVAEARPVDGGRGREVRLRGGTRFAETVLAAEPAERYAYRVDATNAPGLRALLEEWRLTPSGNGAGTRVRYTFAVDAPAPLRWAMTLGRAGVGRAFRRAMRALDRRVASAGR
ncbi:SRPBCC family protein [Streptomyces sp. XD-27]|uniref:SRPBCC family protein n=1 Tax=Streptomyces sp. XD-27 TaxID=3062779 RepID=UPI0026F43024|nr:SRPBCC family protein [Streptomyces sp. XD-27]WKX73636.1 SRPBCC family protein [Streptomyces sp. XD-27]